MHKIITLPFFSCGSLPAADPALFALFLSPLAAGIADFYLFVRSIASISQYLPLKVTFFCPGRRCITFGPMAPISDTIIGLFI